MVAQHQTNVAVSLGCLSELPLDGTLAPRGTNTAERSPSPRGEGRSEGKRGVQQPNVYRTVRATPLVALSNRRKLGALTTELLVAMALLTGVLLPLAYSFASEKRLARACYQRAVAMEIVDGEMEVLAAGEWHSYPVGVRDYSVHSTAATNLPPGHFLLTVETNNIRLAWEPAVPMHGGSVI